MDILPQCRDIQGAAQLGSRVRYRSFGHLAEPSTCSMAYNEQSILDSRQCLLWNPEIYLLSFVILSLNISKNKTIQTMAFNNQSISNPTTVYLDGVPKFLWNFPNDGMTVCLLIVGKF